MKIGNVLMVIAGTLFYTSLIAIIFLAALYMEHSTLFKLLTMTCIASVISWMSLFAIKNEK